MLPISTEKAMQSSPVRVLHVITTTSVGGAENMLWKLLRCTDRNVWPSAVLSLLPIGPMGVRIQELGIPVFSLGMNTRRAGASHVRALFALIDRLNPEILQGWLLHGNLATVLPSLLSRPRHRVLWNVRCCLDAFTPLSASHLLTHFSALLTSRAARIIFNSKHSAEEHIQLGFKSRKCVVIPNGFDCDVFKPDPAAKAAVRAELGILPDKMIIGLVARYHPLKDHAGFLNAAAVLRSDEPDCHFVMVGNGVCAKNTELSRIIRHLKLEDSVSLLGQRSDVPRITNSFDIAVSASRSEGFSNSIGEAMACGIPCVATDTGDSAYIIGNAGLIVPPANPKLLSGALKELVRMDGDCRRSIGEAARARIVRKFSVSRVVEEYYALYKTLLSEPR